MPKFDTPLCVDLESTIRKYDGLQSIIQNYSKRKDSVFVARLSSAAALEKV